MRVLAAAVNPLDWHVMRGSPLWARSMLGMRRPKVRYRGVDVAGRVEAVGADVRGPPRRRRRVRLVPRGLRRVRVRAGRPFRPQAARLTYEEAAAVPLAGMTALQGLRDAGRL